MHGWLIAEIRRRDGSRRIEPGNPAGSMPSGDRYLGAVAHSREHLDQERVHRGDRR